MPEDGQNGSDSWPLKASGGSSAPQVMSVLREVNRGCLGFGGELGK